MTGRHWTDRPPRVALADLENAVRQMRFNRRGGDVAAITPHMVNEVVGHLWLAGYTIRKESDDLSRDDA